MGLTDLPEEIIIIIIKQLDVKSILNLYNTCGLLKNIISMKGVVKECNISMNTLATVRTLKTDFFKAISPNLIELNLSGVLDLRKSYLIPAVKKLKQLQVLDISFTDLDVTDFLDIYKACPTIIDVSVCFINKSLIPSIMSGNFISQCQEIFKNIQHVHLIGSAVKLLFSKLLCLILLEANLESLKFTIADSEFVYSQADQEVWPVVRYKRFFLCFLDWTTPYDLIRPLSIHPLLTTLDLSRIEIIILMKNKNFKLYSLYTSPMFQTFFLENFDVDAEILSSMSVSGLNKAVRDDILIMIWKKEWHIFNETFFVKLKKTLKPFFPCDCEMYNEKSVPEKYDWFYLTPKPFENERPSLELRPRRNPSSMNVPKRIAPSMNVLNYDELFKTKRHVQLSLTFDVNLRNPVALPSNCDYLQKLTFLSMTGDVRLSYDFFTVLFKNSVNLVTVNIESPSIYPCTVPVSRAIHLTSSLKNLRLTDNQMEFKLLFRCLAKCKTLENVHVLENSTVPFSSNKTDEIGFPSLLIEQCPNLYCLLIQTALTDSAHIRQTRILKHAKMMHNKHSLCLVFKNKSDYEDYIGGLSSTYTPYHSVFNLRTIKQI